MSRLFWGLFFVLLDYKIRIGTAVIEALPDFAGFYLLMKGMEILAQESRSFDLGRHWAFGMSLLSGVLFFAGLVNPDTMTKIWMWILELTALGITLAVVKMILSGLREMGKTGSDILKGIWLILVVLLPLCHLLSWLPVVGEICSWASNLASGLFLAAFWRTMKK